MASPDKIITETEIRAGLKLTGVCPFLPNESIPSLQHVIKMLGDTRLEQALGQKWTSGSDMDEPRPSSDGRSPKP